jgi:hypothetical protein
MWDRKAPSSSSHSVRDIAGPPPSKGTAGKVDVNYEVSSFLLKPPKVVFGFHIAKTQLPPLRSS